MNEKNVILPLLINMKNQLRYIIGLTLLLLGAVCLFFVFMDDPEYRASSQLLIEETAPSIPHMAVESSRIDSQTMEAYAAFIKSPEIVEQVQKDVRLQDSSPLLREQVFVSYTANSPILTVTVSSDNRQESLEISNALAFIFQNEVKNSLKADHVSIISPASLEDSGSKSMVWSLVIAAISGFIFSVVMVVGFNAAKASASAQSRDIRKKENQLQTVFK